MKLTKAQRYALESLAAKSPRFVARRLLRPFRTLSRLGLASMVLRPGDLGGHDEGYELTAAGRELVASMEAK